jgi:hypothetical protein
MSRHLAALVLLLFAGPLAAQVSLTLGLLQGAL